MFTRYSLLLAYLFFSNVAAAQYFAPIAVESFFIIPKNQFIPNESAMQKAQYAFLLQSGFVDKIQLVNVYFSKQLLKRKEQLSLLIEEHTPFQSKQVFFVIGMSYSAIYKNSVALSFNTPFISNSTFTVSVTPDQSHCDLSLGF